MGVNNGEVDGVAGAEGGSAVVDAGVGGRGIEDGGARGEVVLIGEGGVSGASDNV